MKVVTRLITMTLMCCAALTAVADEPLWLETSHDFGTFLEDAGRQSCTMRVVNRGDEPMAFVTVRSSCGCTATDYPREAVAPGDTAAVTVTYSPKGRPGQFEKSVFVVLSGASGGQRLVITGRVVGNDETVSRQFPVQAGPLRLDSESVPLGEVLNTANKMRFVSAYNASVDTLTVSAATAAPHLEVLVVPDTVPPGGVTAITVTVDAAKAPLWGFNCDTVGVTVRPLRGNAVVGRATVNVMALVTEDFSRLTPRQRERAPQAVVSCGDRLTFGTVPRRDTPVTLTFTVANRGKDPLRLRRLWAPEGEGLTVMADTLVVKRGHHATVTVALDPSQVSQTLLTTQLHLITNDPDHPRHVIDVAAQVADNDITQQ